jgi:hypothetical protein
MGLYQSHQNEKAQCCLLAGLQVHLHDKSHQYMCSAALYRFVTMADSDWSWDLALCFVVGEYQSFSSTVTSD